MAGQQAGQPPAQTEYPDLNLPNGRPPFIAPWPRGVVPPWAAHGPPLPFGPPVGYPAGPFPLPGWPYVPPPEWIASQYPAPQPGMMSHVLMRPGYLSPHPTGPPPQQPQPQPGAAVPQPSQMQAPAAMPSDSPEADQLPLDPWSIGLLSPGANTGRGQLSQKQSGSEPLPEELGSGAYGPAGASQLGLDAFPTLASAHPPPLAKARKQQPSARSPAQEAWAGQLQGGDASGGIMKLKKKHLAEVVAAADQRLKALLPSLPGVLLSWLFHQLVAGYAQVPTAALLLESLDPVVLPFQDALAVCNTVAYAAPQQVAAAAAVLLDGLRQGYLSGADLMGPTARPLGSWWQAKSGKGRRLPAIPAVTDAAGLSAAVLEVVLRPELAAPLLPAAVEAGGYGGKFALPPPPPPTLRGSIVDMPDPLRFLFTATSSSGGGSSSGGSGGSKLLEQLLKDALASLAVSTALAAAPAGSSQDQADGQLPLLVSPDVDFGTLAVTSLTAEQLVGAAASAAAGLPNGSGSVAAAAAGSLLDILHLSSAPQQQQTLPASNAMDGTDASSSSCADPAAASAGAVLHLRQVVVENCSSGDEIWLLGGVAAPAFPHTLAALDDAHLFWREGHKAVRLGPKQQHTISVALSSADCAARRQEKGILQQLLLLVFAVAPHTHTAEALAWIEGAAVADVPTAAGQQAEAAAEAGTGAAVPAAQPSLPTAAAAFRLFVVARRVTAALVDRPAELASMLDAEAKPFIAERLRLLFDGAATSAVGTFPAPVQGLLATGIRPPDSPGAVGVLPAAWQARNIVLPPAHQEKGQAAASSRRLPRLPNSAAAPLLQRYSRLLVLEEAAMEQDVCRYDMFNVRLRLAVFSGSTTRYRLVSLAPSASSSGGGDGGGDGGQAAPQQRQGGLYRGPAVELLQPRGIGETASSRGSPMYVLGVLDVPGLPEGRPVLLVGDTVYLRTAHQPQREIAALVAATEGSTCFLTMPPPFWALQDVAPLVPLLESTPTFGNSGLFDGLMHVRFSFDRTPLRRMQLAVAAAAQQQLLPQACWLPPCASVEHDGSVGSKLGSIGAAGAEQQQERLGQLQPAADVVAQAAAGMQERGKQQLNVEQRQAVAAVLYGAGRAMPYALFGPPGTGKTVTLVECALQLLHKYNHARLLLCAPQNYSADLLCSALAAAGLQQHDLLRMNDPRRPPYEVKEDVLPFCQYDSDSRMFKLPESVWQRRVVVCTCGAAGLLLQGLYATTPCTFTHVLIDEAGQALLPEALISLSLLAPRPAGTQLAAAAAAANTGWGAVLCGDPRQLGPVVRSQVAAACGLTVSLLEACINHSSVTALQVLQMGHVPATSMLVRNYRSHRRLLDLPSKMFYQGSLLAAADPRTVLPPQWRELEAEGDAWEEGNTSPAAAVARGPEGSPAVQAEQPDDASSMAAEAVAAAEAATAVPPGGEPDASAAGFQAQQADQQQARHAAEASGEVQPDAVTVAAVEAEGDAEENAIAPTGEVAKGAAANGSSNSAGMAPAGGNGGSHVVAPAGGCDSGNDTAAAGDYDEVDDGVPAGNGSGDDMGTAGEYDETDDLAAAGGYGETEGSAPAGDYDETEDSAPAGDGSGVDEGSVASLLFYGVRGQQMREGDAPSYFNPVEAFTVVELISGLLSSGAGVQPDDIGVMATYRKQVQKIRLLLRQRGLGAIRVGTVDDYQGQEERIIFISTVLSRPESLPPARPADSTAAFSSSPGDYGSSSSSGGGGHTPASAASTVDVHLGFWRNPKRFNVAVTRAKALLVVAGHPAVLLEDASWRELLRYCFSQGAYRGAGSDAIRQRFRVDASSAAGALPHLPAGHDGTPEHDDAELQRAIGQLAELALLGAGRADEMFPASLNEMYAASMDEAPFRILL